MPSALAGCDRQARSLPQGKAGSLSGAQQCPHTELKESRESAKITLLFRGRVCEGSRFCVPVGLQGTSRGFLCGHSLLKQTWGCHSPVTGPRRPMR